MDEQKLVRRSIIIPARNESTRIGSTLEKYAQYYEKKYPNDSEILVILNACTDNTEEIVKNYEEKFSNIRHLVFTERGKGFGVCKGLENSKGSLIAFTDADASTKPEILDVLFKVIEETDVDCAIGSRWMKGSEVERQPIPRLVASRTFNFIVNFYFHLGIKDTQCGAKVAKREMVKKILPELTITDMAIDVNYLYDIKKNGGIIAEIPIKWSDVAGSTVNWRTPIIMFMSVSRLRLLNSPLAFLHPILNPIAVGIRHLLGQ
jgi:glycosyltransferase involved in cell wall biosynthesis